MIEQNYCSDRYCYFWGFPAEDLLVNIHTVGFLDDHLFPRAFLGNRIENPKITLQKGEMII